MENTMTNTESNESGENTMTRAIELENGTMTQPTKEAIVDTKTDNTKTETKMKNKVTVSGVVESEGKLTVIGVCDDIPFESSPTRWGSKMLMKVTTPGEFTQGQKIAIGHASKKALKTAEKVLPEAVLVRPRKVKEEAPVQESEAQVEEVSPEV
jgi:hypothetical protein